MWYIDSHMLHDFGMGRVQRELLRINGVFDRYIGELEKIRKWVPNGKVIRQLNIFREKDSEGNVNVFHFPYNFIPEQCHSGIAIVTIHDIIPLRYKTYDIDTEYEEYKRNIAWTVKRADYILTVSEAAKQDVMNYFDIEENRITVVYNPVNDYFKKLDERSIFEFKNSHAEIEHKRIVLTMANKYLYKNLYRTLEAFKLLNSEEAVLVVAGNLKERKAEYINKAAKLNITNRVVFTGNISDEELRLWYNVADIFVFPSLMEGFGLPPVEAMACGTPVITSNVSSLPEVVGDAAVLVNPNDEEEIAVAMRKLLNDQELCDGLTAAGYERVKHFTAEKYRENMKKFYTKVADDMKRGVVGKKDFSQYEIHRNYVENKIFKMDMLYEIAVYWLELKSRNICVSDYFRSRNYRKIAIYGMGKLARVLISELSSSEIDVLYGIDRDIKGMVDGIAVYEPDMVSEMEIADVYVITVPYIYEAIDKMLQSKFGQNVKTIGIDEVVFEF